MARQLHNNSHSSNNESAHRLSSSWVGDEHRKRRIQLITTPFSSSIMGSGATVPRGSTPLQIEHEKSGEHTLGVVSGFRELMILKSHFHLFKTRVVLRDRTSVLLNSGVYRGNRIKVTLVGWLLDLNPLVVRHHMSMSLITRVFLISLFFESVTLFFVNLHSWWVSEWARFAAFYHTYSSPGHAAWLKPLWRHNHDSYGLDEWVWLNCRTTKSSKSL